MKKQMSKKLLVIGILFLCLGASAMASAKQATNYNTPAPKPLDRNWSDNFDSYQNGQLLDGHANDGGWKGWDNSSAAAGRVSNAQARSAPYSDQIWATSDNVHEYTGYTSGQWVFTAWQYIPTNFTGTTYYILLSDYKDGQGQSNLWALQIAFYASGILRSEFDPVTMPIIKGQWIELRTEIDLTVDDMKFYYNNQLVIQKAWTAGPNNQGNGLLVISAVDLFANNSSPVYYDDLSLAPPSQELRCEAGGPYSGEVGAPIHFMGSATGGTPPYTWGWTFGDGGTSTVQNPDHTYTTAGNYTATLTVHDAANGTASDTASVHIIAPIPHYTIESIKGGVGITAVIKNTGTASGTVKWYINLTGGLILLGKHKTGSATIAPNATATIKDMVFGFGKVTITVTAGEASKTASGTVLLVLVLKVA